MKKILFMISSMNIGGVENSLLSLLSAIPKDQFDITLLLLEKKGGFLELVPDWIKVKEVPWYKQIKPLIMDPPQSIIFNYLKSGELHWIPSYVYSYILSEKIVKNRYLYYKNIFKSLPDYGEEFDIAISYQSPTDIIEYFIANKVKANRRIAWVHFDVSKHRINGKLYKRLYSKFNKIFVVSQEAKEKLVKVIPSVLAKTEVFLNIISDSLIWELSDKNIDFDEDYEGIKIVTVGRLAEEKGQDLAIRVLKKLKKSGYDVRWYCIGEGSQRSTYERLIEESGLKNDFILLGSKRNPYPYIAQAHIYVQTSRHEGYCISLAEARCLNKPIVTTNFTGVREQIINGYTGLVARTCAEDLYEKIKYLIENPEKAVDLSKNLSFAYVNTGDEARKLFDLID